MFAQIFWVMKVINNDDALRGSKFHAEVFKDFGTYSAR
jgi:hypothetical protein